MASKIQQQLNFPVRKSGRQSKPSRILQEASEQKSSSAQKRDSRRDSTPQRGASARRKQPACGSHSPCKTDTPKRTASARRQRQDDESPCERDCTPHRAASNRGTQCEDGASPCKRGTPKRTASARQRQCGDQDGASPCKRGTPKRTASARQTQCGDQDGASPCKTKRECTPQRMASAKRTHGKNDASPCRRDCTPQRTFSARRILELDPCSPTEKDGTPVRVARSRQRQLDVDAPLPCKSPSKRKAASLAPPPTPPKSPCKSSARNWEQKASWATSPEIHSEESDSEEEGDQSTSRPFVWPHNMSPTKTTHCTQGTSSGSFTPCGKGSHIPTKNKDCDGLAVLRSPKGQRELRSPSKQERGTVLPPPTPPLSPFVTAGFYRRSAAQESITSRVAPSTPTKSHREVLSPHKSLPTTPQKQQCCEQVLSPSRNRSCTPQKLQSRTVLSPCRSGTLTPQKQQPPREILSPKRMSSSPRKLFTNPQKLASPQKMLAQGNEENFILKSPKLLSKLKLAKPDNSGYQRTKQSLHTAKPHHLVGREEEVGEITVFLKTHLDKGSAGSLYISGAPGTGKTAALLHIIDDCQAQYTCRIAYLNCMMVKDVSSVFRRLHSELLGKPPAGRASVKDMERLVTSSKNSMILVLDEIDQLDSKNQEVLYTIFEWPSLLNSKLILVGVANALDLTDRILPRLQAKPWCRPTLLHFAPYTRTQITAIIHDRLSQSGETIVENSAVQFCARKVAAVAGDMRKALDVCRRAVELAESETRCQTVLKAADCNSPSKKQPGPAVKRIGVAHISRVMGEVYGSSVQAQHSEGVPLQQKLLVCTLLLIVKTGKFKEVLLGRLHETYCKVCRRQQMSPVDQSEFHSLCVLLEARGVIAIKKAKETRLMKITLRQDEKELEQTLKDKVLVSAILADGLPK